MRQPKYKMGQEVQIDIKVKNETISYSTIIRVLAFVRGVFYNPKDSGINYWYHLSVGDADGLVVVSEHEIDDWNKGT